LHPRYFSNPCLRRHGTLHLRDDSFSFQKHLPV
jgi:hypothetical protein